MTRKRGSPHETKLADVPAGINEDESDPHGAGIEACSTMPLSKAA